MKNFIVLMIFAIGLFVSLPSTSSGSGSPPDQCMFVAGVSSIDFPVMVATQELAANTEYAFVSNQTFEKAVLLKEGGFVADQGLFLERQHLYLNEKIESQIKNIESGSRCTIRADSQG